MDYSKYDLCSSDRNDCSREEQQTGCQRTDHAMQVRPQDAGSGQIAGKRRKERHQQPQGDDPRRSVPCASCCYKVLPARGDGQRALSGRTDSRGRVVRQSAAVRQAVASLGPNRAV